MKRKSILKSTVSIILVLCMMFSMTAVATTSASAFGGEYVATQALDKLVELGLRGACLASDAIADSLDDEGSKEVVSGIKKILFMSPEEVATSDCIELCNQIIEELATIEYNMSDYAAQTNSLIVQSQVNEAYKDLKRTWTNNVEKVITNNGLDNLVSNYYFYEHDYNSDGEKVFEYKDYFENYLNTAKKNVGESNDEAVLKAKSAFEQDILVNVYGGYRNDSESLKRMYTSDTVNKKFESAIDSLTDNLISSENVTGYAAQYAMYAYPYSHQQYEYVYSMVQAQIMVVVELEMAYDEYLSLQSDYLIANNIDTVTTENGGSVSFLQIKNNAYDCMFGDNGATEKIAEMLEAERTVDSVDGKVSLSLDDYMKPEDVTTVNMEIQDYVENVDYSHKLSGYIDSCVDGDNDRSDKKNIDKNVKFNRVMSYGEGKENVYYILDSSVSMEAKDLYHKFLFRENIIGSDDYIYMPSCDYVNLTQKNISDGTNTYKAVSNNDVEKLNSLFKTWPFYAYSSSTPSSYLGTGENGYLPATKTYIATSGFRYPNGDKDVVVAGHNFSSDFYLIDASKPHSGTALDVSYLDAKDDIDTSYKYSVILANESDIYKQTAHLWADNGIYDVKITSDDTGSIGNGESAVIPSGDKLSITFKLQSGYTVKSLKCIRNNDVYGNFDSAKTETILLDEGDIDMLTPDENGYYTFNYSMPYSDATFVIETEFDTDLFEKDENGSFIIKTYDDLCNMATGVNSGSDSCINGSFVLTNDIDCKGKSWTTPIGTDTIQFNGTFDGQGHTISNLNVESGVADGNRQGLFAVLGEDAVVKNLTVSNASVFPSENPVKGAGVISKQNNGTIQNCVVTNSSIQLGNWHYLGGIAGLNNGTIENCAVVNSHLTRRWGGSSSHTMGGITETNNGTVKNCYTYGCSFNNGTSDNGAVIANGNAPENCYYYTNSSVNETYGTEKTVEQFASGEVTYLLNNGVTDGTQVWYQNIDNGLTPDSYPVLVNNDKNTVYKVDLEGKTYSNVKTDNN